MREEGAFEKLVSELKACRHCEKEFGFTPHPIQWGNLSAPILQISQAPSKKVHETGIPFNDPSGVTLRRDWYQIDDALFYNKDLFYITQMGHCFPGKSGRGNYDRKPPRCCYSMWTEKEIALKKDTQLIIIVGGEAAARPIPKRPLSELVFATDLELAGIPVIVLPHPSPLNRRWLKSHPDFERVRLPQVRARLHQILKEATHGDL